jgi:enolase-phosphatase E1
MIQYILTDIEGTTTSVSFVYEELFPYFLNHLNDLQADWDTDFVQAQIISTQATLLEEHQAACSSPSELLDIWEKWTRQDRKHPALKALQGWVWEKAYREGKIKGHLYPDVPTAFDKWKTQGLNIGIYSSGSVKAQQLLFEFSVFGDMRPFLSDYFDTQIGQKRDTVSYQHISKQLGIAPEKILFLSDIAAELDAAHTAGFATLQLLRPGNTPSHKHKSVADFAGIIL